MKSGLYTNPTVREMDRSGLRFGLPPVRVAIWPLPLLRCPPLQFGSVGVPTQGSVAVTAAVVWLAKNSEISGRRKPCDQAARSKSESLVCHFKAARPVWALSLWVTAAAGVPGLPPSHLNCDQRSAMSRFMSLANGWSARIGMLNSMYSPSVRSRPSVGEELPSAFRLRMLRVSGWV